MVIQSVEYIRSCKSAMVNLIKLTCDNNPNILIKIESLSSLLYFLQKIKDDKSTLCPLHIVFRTFTNISVIFDMNGKNISFTHGVWKWNNMVHEVCRCQVLHTRELESPQSVDNTGRETLARKWTRLTLHLDLLARTMNRKQNWKAIYQHLYEWKCVLV